MVLEEEAKTYIDPGEARVELVNEGAELLLTSERDGGNHIYLYNGKTGALENEVTKGPWAVRNIVRVEEKNRQIYFLVGRGENDAALGAEIVANVSGDAAQFVAKLNLFGSFESVGDSLAMRLQGDDVAVRVALVGASGRVGVEVRGQNGRRKFGEGLELRPIQHSKQARRARLRAR